MKHIGAFLVILLVAPTLAFGQTSGSGSEGSKEPSAKGPPAGILPLEDYSGDLFSRSHLLGDWGGLRTDLAKQGVRFRGWLTPNVQWSVVNKYSEFCGESPKIVHKIEALLHMRNEISSG